MEGFNGTLNPTPALRIGELQSGVISTLKHFLFTRWMNHDLHDASEGNSVLPCQVISHQALTSRPAKPEKDPLRNSSTAASSRTSWKLRPRCPAAFSSSSPAAQFQCVRQIGAEPEWS